MNKIPNEKKLLNLFVDYEGKNTRFINPFLYKPMKSVVATDAHALIIIENTLTEKKYYELGNAPCIESVIPTKGEKFRLIKERLNKSYDDIPTSKTNKCPECDGSGENVAICESKCGERDAFIEVKCPFCDNGVVIGEERKDFRYYVRIKGAFFSMILIEKLIEAMSLLNVTEANAMLEGNKLYVKFLPGVRCIIMGNLPELVEYYTVMEEGGTE